MLKIGATGLEPAAKNSQPSINQEVTEKDKTATDQKLPKICNSGIKSIPENDTDLQQVISAWPNLPEHIKEAIKALVQTLNKQEK